MAMGHSSRRSRHGRRVLQALWRPQGHACTEKRSLCRIMGQRDKMRQAQDPPGTFAVVQTGYLRGAAMGKAVARILPLQRTAPDGAVLAQGIRYTASKPIVKGAYDIDRRATTPRGALRPASSAKGKACHWAILPYHSGTLWPGERPSGCCQMATAAWLTYGYGPGSR